MAGGWPPSSLLAGIRKGREMRVPLLCRRFRAAKPIGLSQCGDPAGPSTAGVFNRDSANWALWNCFSIRFGSNRLQVGGRRENVSADATILQQAAVFRFESHAPELLASAPLAAAGKRRLFGRSSQLDFEREAFVAEGKERTIEVKRGSSNDVQRRQCHLPGLQRSAQFQRRRAFVEFHEQLVGDDWLRRSAPPGTPPTLAGSMSRIAAGKRTVLDLDQELVPAARASMQ